MYFIYLPTIYHEFKSNLGKYSIPMGHLVRGILLPPEKKIGGHVNWAKSIPNRRPYNLNGLNLGR